jgi:predicted 2-oxoglutarate/Fe(II)-dependent dioxygenase YbiX
LEKGDTGGGAYSWHYEKGHNNRNDASMTAAWSIYVNDDFEGGVLEFKDKSHILKPKPGMLVSIPMTEEWTHRVTPVTKGVRHTLYGTCYLDTNDRDIATNENC